MKLLILWDGKMAIDFYDRLNLLTSYIEQHLDDEIDYAQLAHFTGLSLGTLRRLFPLFSGMNFSEYLRKRRLSLAAKDLVQGDLRVIDVAMKYGYTSQAAFSRAFYKYHQVWPKKVKQQPSHLNFCPKLTFSQPKVSKEISYEIVTLDAMELYGLHTQTDDLHISNDAPRLYEKIALDYPELPDPDYGLVSYEDGRDSCDNYNYWALWREPYYNFPTYEIAASRRLKFNVKSQDAIEIQRVTRDFYENFLPVCDYSLSPAPDLEYYHDGVTEVLVPIE